MTTVVGASSCKSIAQDISTHLGVRYIDATVERFSDQELRIQLPCSVYEEDVIVVQSTCNPANDHLMELLLIIDAVKRAGSRRVITVIPYFGYSRQDRPSYAWGPISARLIATMLEAAGADHMVTLDLHSRQAEGFFKIGVQNIDPIMVFASAIPHLKNILVVSPDIGGLVRAQRFADTLQSELAVIHKTRKTHNACEMHTVIGGVAGKNCILVDDIVDTGATLCQAAVLLKTHKAKSVNIMVTHAVLSSNAQDKLCAAPIDSFVTTNSIPQMLDLKRFQVLDVAPILSQAIRKLMHT
jgi:ribose-phosphate pyrophosphokinase